MNAKTHDAFLGGRLTLEQPAKGYRAGVDPVLLAAAVPATAGQSVLDLGCGVATATLCLAARVPGLTLDGVEVQKVYADLARANAAANGYAVTVTTADIAELPPELRSRSFDHVLMNPPYFLSEAGTSPTDSGRARAFGDDGPLALWIETGLRRLKPRGRLTLIQRAERLPDILTAMAGKSGDIWVWPIAGRANRPADRVLVTGRKGARGPFRLAAPLIMHDGDAHHQDAPDYAPLAEAVLRRAKPLIWPFMRAPSAG